MTTQQRDSIREASPPWLATGVAEKLLYGTGLGSDLLIEKMNQASKAHMPGQGTPTALPLIGNDRLILRGIGETDDSYAKRLQGAFPAWHHAGSARGVLAQVAAFIGNVDADLGDWLPRVAIVGGNGSRTWNWYNTGSDITGPTVHELAPAGSWNWDGTFPWWRAWLILYFRAHATGNTGTAASIAGVSGGFQTVTGVAGMTSADVGRWITFTGAATSGNNGAKQICGFTNSTTTLVANTGGSVGADANNGAISWSTAAYPLVAPSLAWGSPGQTWGDASHCWGFMIPSSVLSPIRTALLSLWKSAVSYYPWILVSFEGSDGSTGTEFSPASGAGTGNPDGTWAHWSKIVNGVRVPARVTGVGPIDPRAMDGSGRYQLCNEQNVT
jgi:hypothetical protein